jgi:diguanylate cyclase (GGDEF)-like protein
MSESGYIYLPQVAKDETSVRSEPAIEAVLNKLEDDDRAVVLAALERAERTEAELRYLADHDSLTGLLDRRRFRAELDQYVSFSARYGGRGAVMIVDIDGLKGINDSLGHHAGDNLIRQVAAVMRERVRATDIVARLSGDEFAILMPQTDVEGAMQLGEDLRAQVADSVQPTSDSEPATISVGVTMFGGGEKGIGSEAVLVAADQAMYRAKEGGRNQIALFRDPNEPQRDPERRQTTAARIRDALTDDPADPQPRLRGDRALRAAPADDQRGGRAAAGGLVHRRGRARWDDSGARPLGRRAGPGAARRAAARRSAAFAARQPLRCFAGRYLGARVHRAKA